MLCITMLPNARALIERQNKCLDFVCQRMPTQILDSVFSIEGAWALEMEPKASFVPKGLRM